MDFENRKSNYILGPLAAVAALDPIKTPDQTGFKILFQEQVIRLIVGAENPRDRLLSKTLYVSGMRVSEVCQLTWANFNQSESAVVISFVGRGSKSRSVLIPLSLWGELQVLKGDWSIQSDFVFRSQKEPHTDLSTTQVLRIIKAIAVASHCTKDAMPCFNRNYRQIHKCTISAPTAHNKDSYKFVQPSKF
jgi:integrase/recombinase XerD